MRYIMDKCPRQDPNNLKADDIFETECHVCGENIEFFKDEAQRKCPKCGEIVVNFNFNAED
jgi:transposase